MSPALKKNNLTNIIVNKKSVLYLSSSLILIVFTLLNYRDESPKLYVNNSQGYVGPGKCIECHQNHSEAFLTSHFNTTQKATEKNLPLIFEEPKSFFMLPNQHIMRLKKEGDQFVENIYIRGLLARKNYFDWIIGSGKNEQGFIANYNQQLFLLNAHYLKKSDGLALSLGESLEEKNFMQIRPVLDECLACHTTLIEKQKWYPEFSLEGYRDWQGREKHRIKDNYILGVTCESCHGPGREHLIKKTGITHPAKLSRERQIQICAYCHSGPGKYLKEMFSFRPGDNLQDFVKFDEKNSDFPNPHSNKVLSLKDSKCFKESQMTCTTCHNVHRNERGNKQLFSLKCLKCHSVKDHVEVTNEDGSFKQNCIDCHMPMKEWKHKYINNNIREESLFFRSHHIGVKRP